MAFSCEVCGNKSEEMYEAEVHGARMIVCDDCAGNGRVIRQITRKKVAAPLADKANQAAKAMKEEIELELAENYSKLIKNARETIGMRRDELALSINETDNLLKRIEDGSLEPNTSLIAKLEKALRIKLMVQKKVESSSLSSGSKKKGLTLADLAEIK